MTSTDAEFWALMDELIAGSGIAIDLPAASRHPRFPEIVYPLDYGYLENTASSDGEGIDLWIGTAKGRGLTGMFVTVDPEKRDSEIKLVIDCTDAETVKIDHFFNGYPGMRALYIPREEQK